MLYFFQTHPVEYKILLCSFKATDISDIIRKILDACFNNHVSSLTTINTKKCYF